MSDDERTKSQNARMRALMAANAKQKMVQAEMNAALAEEKARRDQEAAEAAAYEAEVSFFQRAALIYFAPFPPTFRRSTLPISSKFCPHRPPPIFSSGGGTTRGPCGQARGTREGHAPRRLVCLVLLKVLY